MNFDELTNNYIINLKPCVLYYINRHPMTYFSYSLFRCTFRVLYAPSVYACMCVYVRVFDIDIDIE